MGNGALATGPKPPRPSSTLLGQNQPSHKAASTAGCAPIADVHWSLLSASDVDLLGDRESIINLNAQITHRTLNFGMAEEQLDRAQITGAAVDQGGLGPPQRVSAELARI
jgi:hypothetical protein